MTCDDNISHIARQAAITCLVTLGTSQVVLRYVTHEQPLGAVLQLIVGLLVSCFIVMYFVKNISGVYVRTMILSTVLILDDVLPCQMAWYLQIIVLFHLGEFLSTAVFSPSTLRTSSFLLNHSTAYHVAMVASVIEYNIENYFFEDYFTNYKIMYIGISLSLFGDFLRKFSMFWCGPGFTHLIQYSKRKDHVLVTDGPYRFVRHPGYAGWAIWAISTQVILCNPVCVILYTLATFKFFEDRIPHEELMLFQFFGDEYETYKKHVTFSGIPFVSGPDKNPWKRYYQ